MNIDKETAVVVSLFATIKHGSDPNVVTQTLTQLHEWEKTDQAWVVCNNILRREGYADDVYFSATNVLYQKLKKQFVCLPAGSHEGLKDSLMVALKGFCLRLPQLWKVVSKLSAAVAVLALQMDSWTDPIGSVVQTFGQDAAGARCALFAIMSMPAEAKSATVRVGRLRRAAFTQYLQASLPAVFGFVQTLLAACGGESESEGNGDGKKNTGLASLAFHCLHEWLAAGDVPLDLILRSPLTPAMFVAMRDSTLVRDAANCICSLTSIAKRALRAKQNCDALRTFLVDQTVKLAPLFLGAKKAEDATEYARVFSDVGRVFIMHLAQAQQPNAVEYARVGAALLGLPAQEPFSLCEEYFSAFAREVQVSFAAPDSAFIGVLIPAALEAALAHARLPANYEDLSGDEAEEVDRCRAKDSGSVFASLCAIAGPELVFEKLLCALEAVLAGAGGADAARLAEACLFALVTVLHKLDIDETPELPVQRFLAAVSRLPNAQTIRCEAILAYCRCGRWLPDVVVPQALTIIQRELTTAATTTATASATQYHNDDDEEEEEEERPGPQEYAAKGFHELCKTCPTAVAPHAAELLRVFFFNNGTTTTTTSSSSSAIPRKFISQLLKGFREVAACMDDDNDIIVDALKAFCSTAVASIQQQQQQQQQQTMIGLELKRIAQAFKYLRPNSGIRVVPVFTEVLGVLEAIAQTPALLALSGDDVRGSVPKQLCRCCVAAAVAAGGGTAVRPLLPRMLRLGGLMYKARPRACALDMLAALAANAALDVDLGGGAKSLFVETFGFVTQTTLDLMEATKGAAAVNSPDVFKAYYDLAYEAVKALRYAVVADNAGLARVLEMALAILRSVQERSTVEAVTRFLERLFYTAAIDRQCRTVMEAHVQRLGAQLVHTLLCCACGWQPSRYMYAFALVLFSFRKFSANALLLLAASCLEVPLQGAPPLACGKFPFPVDMDARREFLTALESAPQSSDICDALNQFYFVAASS